MKMRLFLILQIGMKEELKETKEVIKEEEIRLDQLERNNEKIQSSNPHGRERTAISG